MSQELVGDSQGDEQADANKQDIHLVFERRHVLFQRHDIYPIAIKLPGCLGRGGIGQVGLYQWLVR